MECTTNRHASFTELEIVSGQIIPTLQDTVGTNVLERKGYFYMQHPSFKEEGGTGGHSDPLPDTNLDCLPHENADASFQLKLLIEQGVPKSHFRQNHRSAATFSEECLRDMCASLRQDFKIDEVPSPSEALSLRHDEVLRQVAAAVPRLQGGRDAVNAGASGGLMGISGPRKSITFKGDAKAPAGGRGAGAGGRKGGGGGSKKDGKEEEKKGPEDVAVEAAAHLVDILCDYAVGKKCKQAKSMDKPLMLSGACGSGKSALLAHWLARGTRRAFGAQRAPRRVVGKLVPPQPHFPLPIVTSCETEQITGGTPQRTVFITSFVTSATGTRLAVVLRRILHELKKHAAVDEAIPTHDADILPTFKAWLGPGNVGVSRVEGLQFVVVIDGIDHLTECGPMLRDPRLFGPCATTVEQAEAAAASGGVGVAWLPANASKHTGGGGGGGSGSSSSSSSSSSGGGAGGKGKGKGGAKVKGAGKGKGKDGGKNESKPAGSNSGGNGGAQYARTAWGHGMWNETPGLRPFDSSLWLPEVLPDGIQIILSTGDDDKSIFDTANEKHWNVVDVGDDWGCENPTVVEPVVASCRGSIDNADVQWRYQHQQVGDFDEKRRARLWRLVGACKGHGLTGPTEVADGAGGEGKAIDQRPVTNMKICVAWQSLESKGTLGVWLNRPATLMAEHFEGRLARSSNERASLRKLYVLCINRVCEEFPFVRAVLAMVRLSRHGLTEWEITTMLQRHQPVFAATHTMGDSMSRAKNGRNRRSKDFALVKRSDHPGGSGSGGGASGHPSSHHHHHSHTHPDDVRDDKLGGAIFGNGKDGYVYDEWEWLDARDQLLAVLLRNVCGYYTTANAHVGLAVDEALLEGKDKAHMQYLRFLLLSFATPKLTVHETEEGKRPDDEVLRGGDKGKEGKEGDRRGGHRGSRGGGKGKGGAAAEKAGGSVSPGGANSPRNSRSLGERVHVGDRYVSEVPHLQASIVRHRQAMVHRQVQEIDDNPEEDTIEVASGVKETTADRRKREMMQRQRTLQRRQKVEGKADKDERRAIEPLWATITAAPAFSLLYAPHRRHRLFSYFEMCRRCPQAIADALRRNFEQHFGLSPRGTANYGIDYHTMFGPHWPKGEGPDAGERVSLSGAGGGAAKKPEKAQSEALLSVPAPPPVLGSDVRRQFLNGSHGGVPVLGQLGEMMCDLHYVWEGQHFLECALFIAYGVYDDNHEEGMEQLGVLEPKDALLVTVETVAPVLEALSALLLRLVLKSDPRSMATDRYRRRQEDRLLYIEDDDAAKTRKLHAVGAQAAKLQLYILPAKSRAVERAVENARRHQAFRRMRRSSAAKIGKWAVGHVKKKKELRRMAAEAGPKYGLHANGEGKK